MTHEMPVLEAVEILVAEPPLPVADEQSVLGLAELLLKERDRADELLRDESRQVDLIPRFLVLSLVSFTAYACAMVLLLDAAPKRAVPSVLAEGWSGGLRPALGLWLAYAFGQVAAIGICLPSFYFYGLLAGVKSSFLQIVTQCLKGMSSTAIMLIGILPIYVAVALGTLIFAATVQDQRLVLSIGLVLPFMAGLWGCYTIFRGFMKLADTLPPQRRDRRVFFMRRLTLAWAVCYTAVTPLMIHAIWVKFVG